MINDELTILASMGEDFKITPMFPKKMARLLKKYVGIEKPLEVVISIHHRQRSLAQNRWIWLICSSTVMAWLKETQGINYTKDEVYAYVQTAALGRKMELKEIAGEEVIVLEGKRFSRMTTLEFSESVEIIVQYFAERGLDIPLPKPKTNNLVSDYLIDE